MRIVSILEKSKENRSLHDLRLLTPYLVSPGPHILEFMSRQNVKEKDYIQMCTGMKYESLRNGDFACTHGDKNVASSRKMKILLHGNVSIRAPVPPYEMLSMIEEIIENMEANNGVYDPN